jgi:hypothetical protein
MYNILNPSDFGVSVLRPPALNFWKALPAPLPNSILGAPVEMLGTG